MAQEGRRALDHLGESGTAAGGLRRPYTGDNDLAGNQSGFWPSYLRLVGKHRGVITRGNQEPGAGPHRPIGVDRRSLPPMTKEVAMTNTKPQTSADRERQALLKEHIRRLIQRLRDRKRERGQITG